MIYIIAGCYRRQKLFAPKGTQTRPTSNRLREAVFNMCQQQIEGSSFLDIFAGSGAMGFEALSRGAQSAAFIDSQSQAIHCIQSNATLLNVQNQIDIYRGNAFDILNLLERKQKKFNLIYADPPYNTFFSDSLLYSSAIIKWVDTHDLLSPGGLLFIEEDARSEPKLEDLSTLLFHDSRRFGQASLQRYYKKND